MTTITLKNLPDDLYAQLKVMAKANRRSINSEIIVCIEQRVRSRKSDIGDILQKARRLRKKTAQHPISEAELTEAKNAGRR